MTGRDPRPVFLSHRQGDSISTVPNSVKYFTRWRSVIRIHRSVLRQVGSPSRHCRISIRVKLYSLPTTFDRTRTDLLTLKTVNVYCFQHRHEPALRSSLSCRLPWDACSPFPVASQASAGGAVPVLPPPCGFSSRLRIGWLDGSASDASGGAGSCFF